MATSNLSVYIKALWDPAAFEQMQRQLDSANWYLNLTARLKDNRPQSPSDSQEIATQEANAKLSKDTAFGAKAKATMLNMLTGQSSDDMSEEAKKQTKILQAGQNVTAAGIKGLTGITQGSFQFLEMIYNQLKSASPLLQTIESLFNLAVQLFFMPLGNKLAEVMLPAVLDLVDNVVSMWDAMEGMSISQMITHMMTEGVKYFGQFFTDLGEQLIEQGGLLGSIGNLLKSIGTFIEGPAAGLLNTLVNTVSFVVSHLKEIISLIAAFYAMQYTMQLMAMYANAAGQSIFNKLSGGMLALAMIGTIGAAGAIGGGVTYGIMSKYGMASGGYVPATDGGQWRLLGEGGQGEYVVPENQVSNFGGTTNYYYFSGYTDEDVLRMIRDEVSSQISQSRVRGSF